MAGPWRQTLREAHETSKRSLPPRPQTPSKSRRWRHPSSPRDQGREPLQATQTGWRPDAASCRCTACAVVCADGGRAAHTGPQARLRAAASWSRCSPTQSRTAAVYARGNASRSSPCAGFDTDPASRLSCRPAPASPTPCQDADPQALLPHPLRNDADNGGTAAPTSQEPHQPPVPKVPCAPTGSVHPETSASCGPVATSPDPLIRPLAEAKNRTTRVLPNPDNSCAYDSSPLAGCGIASSELT